MYLFSYWINYRPARDGMPVLFITTRRESSDEGTAPAKKYEGQEDPRGTKKRDFESLRAIKQFHFTSLGNRARANLTWRDLNSRKCSKPIPQDLRINLQAKKKITLIRTYYVLSRRERSIWSSTCVSVKVLRAAQTRENCRKTCRLFVFWREIARKNENKGKRNQSYCFRRDRPKSNEKW